MTYQFKIRLANIDNPTVWRQVTIPGKYTFASLHETIQMVFGWPEGDLKYQFFPKGSAKPKIVGDYLNADGEGESYAEETLLANIFTHEGQAFVHITKDGWKHDVILEKILDNGTLKANCLAGEGACPPEYCQGPDDYADMKRILADKTHPEYETTRQWLDLKDGEEWEEVHKFDLAAAKEQIKKVDSGPEAFRSYHFIEYNAFDDKYGLTPALWNTIDNKSARVKNGKKGIIGELEALSHKYPGIPHFKNLLASALMRTGANDRFLEIEQQVFDDFPDYVMARCNLASHYSMNEQLDKAIELLGEELDLCAIYPGRNGGFSEQEVYGYHATAFQYLIKKNNGADAEQHLDFLQHFFPKKTEDEKLYHRLLGLRLDRASVKLGEQKEEREKRNVEVIPEKVAPASEAPAFTHPEVEIFYRQGVRIDRDAVHQIMELPRETLIDDMKKMLIDSIARHDYFYNLDWKEETHNFPVHALFVLSSLKAEEGLDTFFTVMSQSESYLDFWYSDMVTEDFWHFAYLMGQNRLGRLKDFILKPNRYTFVRTAVSEVPKQVALHQPQRRGEAIQWFREVLQYLIDHKDDRGLIDSYVFASLVNDLIDIAGKEEWPFIRQCYVANLDFEEECYKLEEVKGLLAGKRPYGITKFGVHTSIDQFYDDLKRWDSHNNQPAENERFIKSSEVPYTAKPKVGRNDPCPCGSGKKYKKCCGAN